MQGNKFARKGKWKENSRFRQSAEFARNGKCKEWNLEGNRICKELNLQGLEFTGNGICKEWNSQVKGVRYRRIVINR